MAAKKKVTKLPSSVKIPTVWLIVAVLILGSFGIVQAFKNSAQKADINKISTASMVQEGTYTGIVSREGSTLNGKEHERYFLTTSNGMKYLLVGLKTNYEDRGRPEKDDVGQQAAQVKGQGTPNSQSDDKVKGDKNDFAANAEKIKVALK